MKYPNNWLFFWLVLSGLFLCSCGYVVHSPVGSGASRISIATFKNKTFEHELEIKVSKAIRREFILDGSLVLTDPDDADIKLNGEIVDYVLEPYTYGSNESDVKQYRISVKAQVHLQNMSSEEVVWEQVITGEETYYVEGGLAKTEEDAVEYAVSDLAEKVLSRTVSGW